MDIKDIVEGVFKSIYKVGGSFESLKAELASKIEQYGIDLLRKHGIEKKIKNYRWDFTYYDSEAGELKKFTCQSAPNELAARAVYYFNRMEKIHSVEKFEIETN